jgi:hypothetical protein
MSKDKSEDYKINTDLGNQQLKNKIMKYENKIDILKSINQKLRNQNINSNIKKRY